MSRRAEARPAASRPRKNTARRRESMRSTSPGRGRRGGDGRSVTSARSRTFTGLPSMTAARTPSTKRAPDGPISGSVRTWPVRSASAFRRAPCASAVPWIEARRSAASANPTASAAARRTTTVRRHAVTRRASAAGSIAASTAGRNTPASTTPADSAPAITKRRAAPTDGRSTSDRDVGLEGVELLLADARDLHQVLDAAERPVLVTVIDDLLREHGTDPRQVLEVGLGRAVDVHLAAGLLRRPTTRRGCGRCLPLLRHNHLLAVDERPREIDRLRLGVAQEAAGRAHGVDHARALCEVVDARLANS